MRHVTGQDIRIARINAGLSVRALATDLGISAATLTTIERDGTVSPSKAKPVADWMGCKVTELEPFAKEVAS